MDSVLDQKEAQVLMIPRLVYLDDDLSGGKWISIVLFLLPGVTGILAGINDSVVFFRLV